ncbi:hypothetical protein BOTNAR_0049g00220 [Botryotinia narcissicola]|uniref:Uncharacterized protein n=1 Tax=Botryotinia narcissicola TaxID=278944 RepID=A0A4Z1J044_9HELO|nr:hypothetical protein BOTNAR_0049g00220 [Botryotinia narcissicola]
MDYYEEEKAIAADEQKMRSEILRKVHESFEMQSYATLSIMEAYWVDHYCRMFPPESKNMAKDTEVVQSTIAEKASEAAKSDYSENVGINLSAELSIASKPCFVGPGGREELAKEWNLCAVSSIEKLNDAKLWQVDVTLSSREARVLVVQGASLPCSKEGEARLPRNATRKQYMEMAAFEPENVLPQYLYQRLTLAMKNNADITFTSDEAASVLMISRNTPIPKSDPSIEFPAKAVEYHEGNNEIVPPEWDRKSPRDLRTDPGTEETMASEIARAVEESAKPLKATIATLETTISMLKDKAKMKKSQEGVAALQEAKEFGLLKARCRGLNEAIIKERNGRAQDAVSRRSAESDLQRQLQEQQLVSANLWSQVMKQSNGDKALLDQLALLQARNTWLEEENLQFRTVQSMMQGIGRS